MMINYVYKSGYRYFFSIPSSSLSSIPISRYRARREVPFSQEEMYEVVMDVANYKNFLPYCIDSYKIGRKTSINDNANQLPHWSVTVGFGAFNEAYVSEVSNSHPLWIKTRCIDSKVFSKLEGFWQFLPIPSTTPTTSSCLVDFKGEFSVPSIVHRAVIDIAFDGVAEKIVSAFVDRCAKIRHAKEKHSTSVLRS